MLFQSAVITLLTVINIRLVFMKYVPVQNFKTMHHVAVGMGKTGRGAGVGVGDGGIKPGDGNWEIT